MNLVTPEELAGILVRAVNRGLSAPVADHDGGGASFTMSVPSTGQLFTVTVEQR